MPPLDKYPLEREKLQAFLVNYLDPETDQLKYLVQLQDIANRERRTLEIDLDDVASYYPDGELAAEATANARRYARLAAEAADAAMPPPTRGDLPDDVFDVLHRQRQARAEAEGGPGAAGLVADPQNRLPPDLLRRYDVLLRPMTAGKGGGGKAGGSSNGASGPEVLPLRAVGAPHIGSLVTVRGIVTHATDVKPLITVATYLDDASGIEVYQEVASKVFTPLTALPAGAARRAGGAAGGGGGAAGGAGGAGGNGGGGGGGSGGVLHLQTRGSKFVKYQEVKLQELPLEVPPGSTPRSLSIQLRGEMTRTMKPGDSVAVSGIFLPEAPTPGAIGSGGGRRGATSALLAKTFLEATRVEHDKQSYASAAEDAELAAAVDAAAASADVYDRLAGSLAPEIFGHGDVKKALLLALVGGVTRTLPDGMRLRGDVHVCLMGDPGVAKSQLLKHVAHLAPRAVYTTGRGSSGVGLTAAVVRDPVTGESVLEGGALVLADRGVCCIDEFDKMEEADRTAIHEVMEQQTVSIAKAGITTTLNTRATLLAAANPAWGRYDVRRSPAENIALPAALLSRFDLMWLILDRADPDGDRALAAHVLEVHATGAAPRAGGGGGGGGNGGGEGGNGQGGETAAAAAVDGTNATAAAAETQQQTQTSPSSSTFTPLPPAVLRAYVARAKQCTPFVPEALTEYIAAVYAEMRAEEAAAAVPHSYTTARTLLSILRLAQALARLRFAERVGQAEVDEALRLMRMSKHSLLDDQYGVGGAAGGGLTANAARARADPISAIYAALRDDAQRTRRLTYPWDDLVQLLQRGGRGGAFTPELIRRSVEEYANLGVFSLEYPRGPLEPTVVIAEGDLAS